MSLSLFGGDLQTCYFSLPFLTFAWCVFLSWACGVILFTLLAGSPPFWHRKQMLMLRMIMEGRYQFSSPEWDDRSDTVKDLVSSYSQLILYCSNPNIDIFSAKNKSYCSICIS